MQNWIADSAAEIHACRLMTLDAAHKIDEGDEARVEVSLIKFYAARVLNDVIDRAVQVHGALGLTDRSPLSDMLRQARAARIYDGPDEVHRMVVSRRILKEYAAGGAWRFNVAAGEPETVRRCSSGVRSRCLIASFVTLAMLLVAPAAASKGFEPGDLRICNAKRCVPIMSRPALTALGVFYYIGTKPPSRAPRAHVGAPSFELRFDNGYVTGIVATRQARSLPELRRQHRPLRPWTLVPSSSQGRAGAATAHSKSSAYSADQSFAGQISLGGYRARPASA